MTTVCSRCLLLKRQVSPLNDGMISHGLCREHELETLAGGALASPGEVEELTALRAAYVEVTVRVPAHVAARLKGLCETTAAAGHQVDPAIAGGIALAREINRTDYESVPAGVYAVQSITGFDAVFLTARLEHVVFEDPILSRRTP